MEKKLKINEIVIFGLALFATYFGAGNLIFPPILGLQSGTRWLPSLIGLILSGIFLPVLGIVVIGLNDSVHNITKHVGKGFYDIIIGAIMLIVLFVANPRTAAVGIEMGIKGIFPEAPYWPLVILYFLVVFFLAKNKGSTLDRIGKYLTPVMATILFIIVIKGITTPIGTPIKTDLSSVFANSFVGGYQTGDLLVSFLLAGVFLETIHSKGYTSKKSRNKVTISAAIIAFVCLSIIYGGLFFIGACGSGMFPPEIGRAELFVSMIPHIGGQVVMSGLGLAVILACTTTAVAQATAASDFFVKLSKDKFDYQNTLAVVCFISASIALIGVDKIVKFSNPLYMTIYPVVIALLLFGIFGKLIPNDGAYKGAVICTLIYSVSEAILSTGLSVSLLEKFVKMMPLNEVGAGWILPYFIGFILGAVIYPIVKKEEKDSVLETN